MANVFEKILKMAPDEVKRESEAAIDWYREKASGQRITPNKMLTSNDYRDNFMSTPTPGSMFLFQYDAKHKETLPYWDKYPLIFPFQMESNAFYGLNLHYLPPVMRASLMSNLANRKPRSAAEDISISYKILSSYSRLRYYRPCVKMYLFSQVKSPFLYINREEWPIAIFLPLQRFQKASDGKVYADSRKMLR